MLWSRAWRTELADSVFERSDLSNNGTISLREFGAAVPRLLRPINCIHQLRGLSGWPGAVGALGSAAAMAQLVSSLRTGDVVLVKIDDTMGRFLQYGLDTPWNHACVVMRRSPLDGTPNEKTEALLQQFPFRRASHQHCSPGYCRCYDEAPAGSDFAPSGLAGCGDVGLLESTGEGIHLYDLAHRLFEARAATRYSVFAVRRLRGAAGRDDDARVAAFVRDVRGSLYSTIKDELKLSLQHHAQPVSEAASPPDLPHSPAISSCPSSSPTPASLAQ